MTSRNEESEMGLREGDDVSIVERAGIGSPSSERDGRVVGVMLAAGTSSRFGAANKLLAAVDGQPLIRHATLSLVESCVDRVIVVVGHEADRVRAALGEFDIEIVVNEDYDRGQATSVRTGVRAAREAGARAVVVALGDMPWVDSRTIDLLVEAYRADAGDALAMAHKGRRGNPVLFDSQHFDALCDVSGDMGGRRILLESSRAKLVETGDPGVLQDIDTREDLDRVG